MAESIFQVTDIRASLRDKAIYITLSKEPDPDTVNQDSVFLLNKENKTLELLDIDVDKRTIKLQFRQTPVPNINYALYIQSTVKSLVENLSLDESLMRNLSFKSDVISTCTILSPSNFERTKTVDVSWQETGEKLENTFRLQIATENIFTNCVIDTVVNGKNQISLDKPFDNGQYYIRVRSERLLAEDFAEMGRWSEIVTFIYYADNEEVPLEPPLVEDNSEPPDETTTDIGITIEDRVKADEPDVTYTTEDIYELLPESISVLFSEDILCENASIKVIRRDI